jgi:hypothetical protein
MKNAEYTIGEIRKMITDTHFYANKNYEHQLRMFVKCYVPKKDAEYAYQAMWNAGLCRDESHLEKIVNQIINK